MGAKRLRRYGNVPVLALSLVLSLAALSGVDGQSRADPPSSVPKALCGPGDRTENGLQGQTTAAERFSAVGSKQAFNCNLELVGAARGEGANWDMAVFDSCVYVGTANGPQQRQPGTMVVDVSNPRDPRVTAHLDSRTMTEPNETLAVHTGRKLLIGGKLNGEEFEVYDLSGDCRRPVLTGRVKLPGIVAHAGEFAPDGRTYYGTSYAMGPPTVFAIDVVDPSKPREIARWIAPKNVGVTHHLSINEDGTRAYVGLIGNDPKRPGSNGVTVLDISDVKTRQPSVEFRILGRLVWDDGAGGQVPKPITINGRPYLVFTDVTGPGGPGSSVSAAACAQGLPPHGFARIIDIGDLQNLKIIAKLMLEVSNPGNCARVLNDPLNVSGYAGYSSTFCVADDPRNAKLLACGYYEAGLRVFDIRDPSRPREIAYYKPPARGEDSLPGSGFRDTSTMRTADAVILPYFPPDRDEIWFISHDNGFQIVRFTDWIKATENDLF